MHFLPEGRFWVFREETCVLVFTMQGGQSFELSLVP
jgi:hypothetical protein